MDRFTLPFEPDRETYTTCAYCQDDILVGHEAYTDGWVWLCHYYCVSMSGNREGFERQVAGE